MRLQLLSDLHLETERFEPAPAPGAELLVLAGDVDSRWTGLERFGGWPVPVLFVPGNHEYDGRDLESALPALREHCARLAIRLLDNETAVLADDRGRRIRFVASTRWCDFDLFGEAGRTRAMRAAKYYMAIMKATYRSSPFDPPAVREVALASRRWLQAELAGPRGDWERTVVVTHFAPSVRSADPRYGSAPGTASFCNADDALLPGADLWIHGHLHCRQDYVVEHPTGKTRVVCNSRGHTAKGEAEGFDGLRMLEV